MQDRNESINERLNRELWRARLFNRHTWLTALVTIAIFLLIMVLTVRIPAEITYRQGIMAEAMPLATETGTMLVLSVRVDDVLYHARTRAKLLHPARGDQVCLRMTRDWGTGRLSVALDDLSRCKDF